MSFKDHFSRQAAACSRYRPAYPRALIEYVAAQCPRHRLAVDCATGNGQAAVALAERFAAVLAVAAAIDDFYLNVVGGDWPPERRYVEQGYRTRPFPWREEPTPVFQLETDWNLPQVMGHLATWSAVQRCKDGLGHDPLETLEPRRAALWPCSGTKGLRWPIHLRLGRA